MVGREQELGDRTVKGGQLVQCKVSLNVRGWHDLGGQELCSESDVGRLEKLIEGC